MLLQRTVAICALNLLWIMASNAALAEEFSLHRFTRQQLTSVYFSEGANAGDVNGDAIPDVVYGPHWYEGPAFEKRHEIYPPVAQDTNRYATTSSPGSSISTPMDGKTYSLLVSLELRRMSMRTLRERAKRALAQARGTRLGFQ